MEPKSKLTAKSHGRKITVELPWDATIDQWFDAFKTLMIGITFEPEAFDDEINGMADKSFTNGKNEVNE